MPGQLFAHMVDDLLGDIVCSDADLKYDRKLYSVDFAGLVYDDAWMEVKLKR
jgi:hypothetical protein